ncbi:MAG: CocE/NonD family hydrolase [Actinomycetota bacterium]
MLGSRTRPAWAGAAIAATVVLSILPVERPALAQQLLPCDQGSYDPDSYSHVSDKGPFDIGEQEIVELESDVDGATIQMGVIRPDVPAGTKVPVILTASVYLHPLQEMDLRNCRPFLINNYVPHGYAVAVLAVRGTADSGGCMNLMGPQERADIDHAVTWLGTRPWADGNVGMIGKSYDGATAWMGAAFRNPHLKTIVPASGVPDLFGLMFGAGTPDWRGPTVLQNIYYVESGVFYAPGRSPEHTAEVLACPEYAVGNAASAYTTATGMVDPFGYWEERIYTRDIERNYRGSIFLIQGLQDWNVNPGQQFPWIKTFEKRGLTVKYMLGQWGHSWPDQDSDHYRGDFADILLDWFDRWLKQDRSAPIGPTAQVEDADGKWRDSSNWPPTSAETVRLWLTPEDALSEAPSKDEAVEIVAADPLHTQHGYSYSMPPEGLEDTCIPDVCAYFETPPLKEDLRIAGLPQLDLRVVPSGPGGGLSAYLYQLSEQGATRVGWGQVNLAFKAAGVQRNVTPGEEMRLRFDLQPLDARVPEGSKLALLISHGSGWNRLPSAPSYPIQLLEGGRAASFTFLEPEVEPGDFFKPPR